MELPRGPHRGVLLDQHGGRHGLPHVVDKTYLVAHNANLRVSGIDRAAVVCTTAGRTAVIDIFLPTDALLLKCGSTLF